MFQIFEKRICIPQIIHDIDAALTTNDAARDGAMITVTETRCVIRHVIAYSTNIAWIHAFDNFKNCQ